MKKLLVQTGLFFSAVLLPTLVFAAGSAHGDSHHIDWMGGLVYPAINFFVLMSLLIFAARKPIREFFKNRSAQTKDTLEQTKSLYEKAYREFEEINAKLKNADQEGKTLLKKFQEEAELEKQKTIQEANQIATKIKSDAQRIAENEVKKAVQILKQHTVELSLNLAKEKIKKEVTLDNQVSLSQEFVTKM